MCVSVNASCVLRFTLSTSDRRGGSFACPWPGVVIEAERSTNPHSMAIHLAAGFRSSLVSMGSDRRALSGPCPARWTVQVIRGWFYQLTEQAKQLGMHRLASSNRIGV